MTHDYGDPENPTLPQDADDLAAARAREADAETGGVPASVRIYRYARRTGEGEHAYCLDCTLQNPTLYHGMTYSVANHAGLPCELCGRHEGER